MSHVKFHLNHGHLPVHAGHVKGSRLTKNYPATATAAPATTKLRIAITGTHLPPVARVDGDSAIDELLQRFYVTRAAGKKVSK